MKQVPNKNRNHFLEMGHLPGPLWSRSGTVLFATLGVEKCRVRRAKISVHLQAILYNILLSQTAATTTMTTVAATKTIPIIIIAIDLYCSSNRRKQQSSSACTREDNFTKTYNRGKSLSTDLMNTTANGLARLV